MKRWGALSAATGEALDPILRGLVETRASQINGCASCLNMHTTWAREHGETEQRLYLLPAWREARHLYSEREQAALAWTEALTRLSEGHTHEKALKELQMHFTEEEQVALTLVINVINGWNRLTVGFGLFIDPAEAKAQSATFAPQAAA